MATSIKRTLSIESLFPAFKAHCPDLESQSFESSVESFMNDSHAEIKNPFTTTQKQHISPRWPLEQPELPLTFSVLNSKQQQAAAVAASDPEPVPSLEQDESPSDESCDEYFNYDSLPASPTSLTATVEKRTLNFRLPAHQPTWADNVTLNRKRVRAAWGLMGNIAQNREAYYEQVMLASQSLNTTSLFTGLARQTMAPAPEL